MNKYNFDETVNRFHSGAYKWDVKENELPMTIADMDFHVLPEIKQAIIDRLNIDSYGYSECPKEYFECYKKWWSSHHQVNLETEWMMFSLGVVASIDSILKHLVSKGSGVIIFSPVYHVFYHCIINNNLKVIENKLIKKEENYEIDFANLEYLLKQESNKALILCNPHNPVGRIWNKEELQKIVYLCKENNVLLISDEIHCDITEPGQSYNSIYSVSDEAIALLSPTKVFNLAGIQTSIVMCKNKELREKIADGLRKDDLGEPNYIASYATIAAFTYGEKWREEMCEYVYNNKRYVQEFLNEQLPHLKMVDIKATYLLWIDISHYSNNSEKFVNELREKTGLILSPGYQFGSGGEGYVRINIATSLSNVKDACQRLKRYIDYSF